MIMRTIFLQRSLQWSIHVETSYFVEGERNTALSWIPLKRRTAWTADCHTRTRAQIKEKNTAKHALGHLDVVIRLQLEGVKLSVHVHIVSSDELTTLALTKARSLEDLLQKQAHVNFARCSSDLSNTAPRLLACITVYNYVHQASTHLTLRMRDQIWTQAGDILLRLFFIWITNSFLLDYG